QRDHARVIRKRDHAQRRALTVREVEILAIGAEGQPARLRQGGLRRASVRKRFLAGAGEASHLVAAQVKHADLMRTGIREKELVPLASRSPGRGGARGPPRLRFSEGQASPSSPRQGGYPARCQIDAPNRVILSVRHVERVARGRQSLRMIETSLFLGSVE